MDSDKWQMIFGHVFVGRSRISPGKNWTFSCGYCVILTTMKPKRVIIKLGTNAISNEDGTLDGDLIEDLVGQVAKISEEYNVLLVTSGAVGSGISLIGETRYDETTNRQVYAAVGQVQLMKLYSRLFDEHKLVVAQMLATKADFTNRNHYLNMKNCLESLFKENIIPIMNENDFVAVEELMFTDNDELAGLVAKMMEVNTLVVLTDVDGVYDEEGNVIKEFGYEDAMPDHIAKSQETSSFGKGGIQTKFKMAQESAKNGAEVFIVNSKVPDLIPRIIDGEHIGTKFLARDMNNHRS